MPVLLAHANARACKPSHPVAMRLAGTAGTRIGAIKFGAAAATICTGSTRARRCCLRAIARRPCRRVGSRSGSSGCGEGARDELKPWEKRSAQLQRTQAMLATKLRLSVQAGVQWEACKNSERSSASQETDPLRGGSAEWGDRRKVQPN